MAKYKSLTFRFSSVLVLETNIWDPVVAQWLLNPDKPTSSFQQMLADNGIQQKVFFLFVSLQYLQLHTCSEDKIRHFLLLFIKL